jgi:hypothetical protein
MSSQANLTGLMLPTDMQETNERLYVKKHIDGYIETAILENPDMVAKITEGAIALGIWLGGDYYASKNKRLAQINGLDLEDIVLRIFTQIAYCQVPETFVSVTSQLAGFLGFDDKQDSITTVAEMVAVLCRTDAFDIIKESPQATMMVQSRIPLPKAIVDAAVRSKYVLPMVCEPEDITSNFESPYLTFNECQILGKGNNHAGDICLDVINTQNKVPLKLDLDFLSQVEEEPTFELDSLDKFQLWSQFKQESYESYYLLAKQGNKFWLTNKVDKRGRLYAQGYHITSQGSSFKKAMLELYEEELVEGVPDAYSL